MAETVKVSCVCQLCERHRRVETVLRGKDIKAMIHLIRELESRLDHTEADLNYDEAVLDGSWPSAPEILSRSLERAKGIAAQRLQEETHP